MPSYRPMRRLDHQRKLGGAAFHPLKTLLLVGALATAAVGTFAYSAPLPGQIIANPDNRSWLMYSGGGPFFLASPGDPEDFLYRGTRNVDGTRSGDQDQIIAKLGPTGANGIYFQVIRSHGGDGDSTHNPFVNNDPAQGLNDAVLDQWESWFNALDSDGIVIYLFFYDDSARIWNSGDTVDEAERQFFEQIVNRFEHHKHLIWVIAEEYSEAYSAQRVASLAAVIRTTDDHDHPIAVHKLNGTSFDEFASDPNIDQFAMQYNVTSPDALHAGVVSAWNNAGGQYNVNMSEATAWGTGEAARKKAWASALGGAYVMGLGMNIINTPTSDLVDLGRLRYFMEATDFHRMSPQDQLAAGDADWILASNDSYIVYGSNVVASIGITSLAAGTYTISWFDTITGASTVESDVQVAAGQNIWNKPGGFTNEVAVYITKDGAAAPTPLPPSDLTAE
jgi:hypothetical protein